MPLAPESGVEAGGGVGAVVGFGFGVGALAGLGVGFGRIWTEVGIRVGAGKS